MEAFFDAFFDADHPKQAPTLDFLSAFFDAYQPK